MRYREEKKATIIKQNDTEESKYKSDKFSYLDKKPLPKKPPLGRESIQKNQT